MTSVGSIMCGSDSPLLLPIVRRSRFPSAEYSHSHSPSFRLTRLDYHRIARTQLRPTHNPHFLFNTLQRPMMNFLKSAANAASNAAKSAAESAKKTYAELQAPPTSIRCIGCPEQVLVPPAVFDWACSAGHVNKRQQDACSECKVQQPPNLPEPTVTCPSCQSVTKVPLSNARKHAREAAVKTKEFAVATAAATKAGVEHLRAAPSTFHCSHCDTLLAVPSGPWACQTCTCENEEEAKTCKQCGQKKSEQKAICGVCRQSTTIPSSNFVDGLKHTAKSVQQSSKKVYYDVANKPYISCNKCGAHVSIDKKDVAGAAPQPVQGMQRSPPPPQQEGAMSPPPSGEGAAPGGAAAQQQQPEIQQPTYSGAPIMCPNCKNPVN